MDQDPRSMSLGISQWIWQTPQSVSPRCQSCFQCETCQRAYCSFRSVNCFSSVVISSRHSILLLSQSSSSISVHIQTWQLWQPLHTTTAFYPHPHDNPTLHFTPKQPVSPFLREITRTVKHINYTRVCNTSLTVQGLFFPPELSPSSDTDELTVSSSSVVLPSCSGKSTSISSWLLSFFSREWTGIATVR